MHKSKSQRLECTTCAFSSDSSHVENNVQVLITIFSWPCIIITILQNKFMYMHMYVSRSKIFLQILCDALYLTLLLWSVIYQISCKFDPIIYFDLVHLTYYSYKGGQSCDRIIFITKHELKRNYLLLFINFYPLFDAICLRKCKRSN